MDVSDSKAGSRSSFRWIGLGFIAAMVMILVGLGSIWVISWKLPSVESLKEFHPPIASEVWSAEFEKIGEFYQERRAYVPLTQIPALLSKAFVAAEDSDFYQHGGISPTGIARAFLKNMQAGTTKQGGSTITQQVAKQLLLSPERSLLRKVREAILAYKMERFLTKEAILEIYLNQIYLGHSAYGVKSAAQVYYGKALNELTLAEMAVLAGLPRAPSRDNPLASMSRAKEKQAYVLARMVDEGFITTEQKETALGEPLELHPEPNLNLKYAPYYVEHVRRYVTEKYGDDLVLKGGLQIFTGLHLKAAIAAENALRAGIEESDRHQGFRGPLNNLPQVEHSQFLEKLKEGVGEEELKAETAYKGLVTELDDEKGITTVNLGTRTGAILLETMSWARRPNSEELWSKHLIEKPSEALSEGDVILVRLGPPPEEADKLPAGVIPLTLYQEPKVQGALIAIEPHTGVVWAMVGGYDYRKSEFNRTVQARRQPGSAFKPITYAAALDNGYTPASILIDAPFTYDDPTTEFHWRPKNYGGRFHGETIFRDCLIKSRNVPTIKVLQELGVDKVISYAQRMGISSPLARNFSLALGSSGITPLELVSAYSVFPNNGKKLQKAIVVKKIVDRDGNVLERNVFADPALNIVEQGEVARQLAEIKQLDEEAVEIGKDPKAETPPNYALNPQTAYIMTHLLKQVITSGTGRRAAAINRPAAGKTGTTNDNHDAWFVGFVPSLVAAVWLGFDDSTQTLGVKEEGGRAASPVWLAFMQEALKEIPQTDFKVPDGLIFAQIDPKTGKLATAKTEDPIFEVFREGTEPTETTEEEKQKESSQQFFLQE